MEWMGGGSSALRRRASAAPRSMERRFMARKADRETAQEAADPSDWETSNVPPSSWGAANHRGESEESACSYSPVSYHPIPNEDAHQRGRTSTAGLDRGLPDRQCGGRAIPHGHEARRARRPDRWREWLRGRSSDEEGHLKGVARVIYGEDLDTGLGRGRRTDEPIADLLVEPVALLLIAALVGAHHIRPVVLAAP